MQDDVDTRTTVQAENIAGFPALVGRPARPRPDLAPVVFLHGAFADHVAFRGWVGRFAATGRDTVAAARRGRLGVGPERAAGLTFDDYVDDTLAVVDALGRAPVVVGHSLGGLVAQRVAELGRARALVLLASAPPGMLTAQAIAFPRFAPKLPRIMTGRPFVVGNDACSVLALNRVPEAARPAIHAHLTEESGRVYRSMMLGTIRIDASKVRVPVFVAGGVDDRIISTRLVRTTARHYRVDARLYDDHGHWLLEEPGWERLADDVVEWLEHGAGAA
jgi:pimeloyl-ACP methyl ester carboxylesterase